MQTVKCKVLLKISVRKRALTRVKDMGGSTQMMASLQNWKRYYKSKNSNTLHFTVYMAYTLHPLWPLCGSTSP